MYLTFRIVRPYADVRCTLQIIKEGDEIVCGLRFIEGEINLPPRAMRGAIIKELETIEALARNSGCTEMRHAGDDRAWCLPGYEPMPELPHGRRKRL